jgi:uncharacterized protein YegL
MSGERWNNLLKVLKEILNKIKNSFRNGSNSRVSIIKFNYRARIIIEREKPEKINVDEIPFSSGWTNFNSAF